MQRGIGAVETMQELLPEWAAVVAALLTQLGDFWFLALLLFVLYWAKASEGDDVVLVGGILLAATGVYRTLKRTFELPRPNKPLLDPELLPSLVRPFYEATAFASGYGFPSGHATSAAVVYFGLAAVLTVWDRRLRYAVAAGLVTIVGLTRVVLGFHYLVDIVAGVAVGLGLVWLGLRGINVIDDDRVTIMLFVAIATSVTYFRASGGSEEAILLSGATLGLFGGWQLVVLAREAVAAPLPAAALRPVALRGGLAALSLGPLVVALGGLLLRSGEPFAMAGLAGLGAAVILLVPVARQSRRLVAAAGF